MSGISTNGLPLAVAPLTGAELAAFDTTLPAGQTPESEAISLAQVAAYVAGGATGGPAIATPDSGATQTLTAAMISVPAARDVVHVTTGGSTPSLTLPLATALLTALPQAQIGTSYVLRVINANSGTATIVTNTGWTTTGTLTLATGTWREFIVAFTNVSTGTVAATFTSIGTGTNS